MTSEFVKRCLTKLSSNPEKALSDKIKKNLTYPFNQDDTLLILEYSHVNLWRGSFLLFGFIIATAIYMYLTVGDPPKYLGFLIFGLCVSLWLLGSGVFRRRLVIDHENREYRFYIHSHLRHRGPLNDIYISMIAQKSCSQQLMYKLTLNGYKIEKRELSAFSVKYQLLECHGRRIATTLNLNYFDYKNPSTRHMIIHRPKLVLDRKTLRTSIV